MIDQRLLMALPTPLRAQVIGIAVESSILLELGPSPYRDYRLAELQKEAIEVAELAREYIPNLSFRQSARKLGDPEILKQALIAGAVACALFGVCIAAPLGAGLFLL